MEVIFSEQHEKTEQHGLKNHLIFRSTGLKVVLNVLCACSLACLLCTCIDDYDLTEIQQQKMHLFS